MQPDGRSSRERVARRAAEWVIRLASGGCGPAEHAKLEAWLRESPVHEVAFERESLAWERTERLRALRPANGADVGLIPEIEAAPRARAMSARPERRRASTPWRAAAALLCVVAAAAGFLWFGEDSKAYATAVGERRVIVLPDGSRMELNTDTQVVVRMSRAGRRAKLVHGEALFDVHPDQRRPFVVAAQDEEVRGVDGAFNILMAGDGVRVLVVEGAVEVHGRAGPDKASFDVRLPAGSLGVYGATEAQSRIGQAQEVERALAWRQGAIWLAGETLQEAAAEFNRYNTRRLVISDPSIANLRFGGYFRETDIDGFVRALQTSVGVQAKDAGSSIYLSRDSTPGRPPQS